MKTVKVDNGAITKEIEESKLQEHLDKGFKVVEKEKPKKQFLEGDVLMGTVINEVGSSAGGTAKVEYKDQNGNVLWYYDDAGNFVRNGNAKITGLAGAGARMVVS